jgi:DNA gyrase subunit A
MRARAMIETKKRTEEQAVVITEIPYMVNKADLVTQIAGLIRDKKLEGASDVRDESSREGLRVVVSLKRGAVGEILLNQLYASTRMEASFGIQLLAIDEGQPRLMPLRNLLQRFLDFRREVVTRRTRFELRKAEERLHILEGLVKALDNLDAVIELIRKAKTPDEARAGLSKRFKFTTPQAQAILDMRLQRLTGLERQKIVDEHKETRKEIARLKEILDSTKVLMKVIRDELQEIRKTYANERRTEIVAERVELSIEDLIVEEDVVITCSHAGYIKRTPLTTYRRQHRGGKGRIGMTTREEDFVEHLFVCSTHDYLLVFTEKGRVYWLKGYEIPQVSPAARGKPIVQLLKMGKEDKLAALLKVSEFEEGKFIISCTESGVIKKTALKRYSNPRSGGIIAQKLRPGDRIIGVELTDGARDIFIATAQGKAIRFPEKDARDMGRVATGVRGVRLRKGDKVVDMATISRGRGTVLTVCERGYGKRTEVDEYRLQGRGGQGVINIRTSERNGEVVGSKYVGDEDELMIITERGKIIRTRIKPIRTLGRSTQGMRLIELGEDDGVVAVAHVAEHVEEAGGEPPAEPTDGGGPALIETEKEGETPQG